MEVTTISKRGGLRRLFQKAALKRLAKELVRSSEESSLAGDEILYRLPGVFSFVLEYQGESVRLIKEANSFRIMENSEKSAVLLSATVMDGAALCDIYRHRATWQKVYAEGRIAFGGKAKYAMVVIRVAAEGDKARLHPQKYQELYGE